MGPLAFLPQYTFIESLFNLESISTFVNTNPSPTRAPNQPMTKSCHMARSRLSSKKKKKTLALLLHYFEFSTLAPLPLPAAASESLACLQPSNRYHRDCLAAGYQPRPNSDTSAALLATRDDVFLAGFHLCRRLSGHFLAPANNLL